MNNILRQSLFVKQNYRFNEVQEIARVFLIKYVGNIIIKDNIFSVIENYVKKKNVKFEMLKFPIDDEELWAVTFLREDTIFMYINTKLPLCKQFFAACHELYHIYRYCENEDESYIKNGSLLDFSAEENHILQEDLEANAFAGMLLMPKNLFFEQADLYDINVKDISLDNILTIMDIFALPYKATILRLYEIGVLNINNFEKFSNISFDDIKNKIFITGKAKKWQLDGKGTEMFGTIFEKNKLNNELELYPGQRKEEENEYIRKLKAIIGYE